MRPDLGALIAYWQKALRLEGWRIQAEYVQNLCASDGSEIYGLCSRVADNRTARIQIRDPETPIADGLDPNAKVEEIVIHELLHLHFAPFETRSPAEVVAEEQAVWSIAEALYNGKGSGQEGAIVRSMLALTMKAAPARMAAVAAGKDRQMDPQLLAMLKAVSASKDPAAGLEALIKELEGAGSEPAPPSTDMPPPAPAPAAGPKAPGDMPPPAAAAAPAKDPEPPAAPKAARPAASPAVVDLGAVRTMVAEGLDAFKRDELLKTDGQLLGDDDLKWARTQPYEVVRRMVGVAAPAGADVPRGAPQRAARGTAPARGANAGASRLPASEKAELDERMGLGAERAPVEKNGNVVTFRAMTPSQATKHMAATAAAKSTGGAK